MNIQIRLLGLEELKYANDFFNKIYSTNRTIEAFNWEFVNGPCGPAIYVAAIDLEHKESLKIIGIQCAIPLKMITGSGQEILTAKSEDTLVDPAYRGFDIFNKMYAVLFDECKKANIKYIWGFTPAQKPFLKLGFDLDFHSNQVLMVLKPLKAYNFLSSLNSKNKAKDKVLIMALSGLSWLKSKKQSIIKIKNKNYHFSDKIKPSFIYHSNLENDLFLYQDESYLKWRIEDNLYSNAYSELHENKDVKALSQLILNIRNDVGYIEQMLFNNVTSISEKKKLVRASIDYFQSKEVSIIRFLGFDANEKNKEELSLLSNLGFTIIKRGNWFVWKSLDERFTHKAKDVYLSRLYTQGNN